MKRVNTLPYELVELSEQNIFMILPLYHLVFGMPKTKEELIKKYKQLWTKKPFYGIIAVYKEKAIGFTGICAYQFKQNEQLELAADFTDCMVHPDFQKNGIFPKIMQRVEELAIQNDFHFTIGFGNQRSQPVAIYERKWSHENRLVRYSLPIITIPINKVFRKMGLQYLHTKWCKFVLKKYEFHFENDVLQQQIKQPEIIRNKDYFVRKESPAHILMRIDQTLVWIKINAQLCVGFVKYPNEIALLKTIEKLKYLCKILGINEILFQLTSGCEQDKLMEKHFEKHNSWHILNKNLSSNLNLNDLHLEFCDLDSF